jgi:hypothetical protein
MLTKGQQWALSYPKLIQLIPHTLSIIAYVSITTSATSISLTGESSVGLVFSNHCYAFLFISHS